MPDYPPRISDLVCGECGHQFETIQDRDEHDPCPEQ